MVRDFGLHTAEALFPVSLAFVGRSIDHKSPGLMFFGLHLTFDPITAVVVPGYIRLKS
jgi:hypothetical protein